MNITEFLKAIKYLKNSVTCPKCKARYKNRDIYINDFFSDEIFFVVDCRKCNHQNMIHVYNQLKNNHQNLEDDEDMIFESPMTPSVQEPQARTHKAISKNDYLDVKNFLKGFDGDFKKIFK